MGLPGRFEDIIHSGLNVHAAWLPITQTYELGDYGVISDGVFARLGNIKEFGVTVTPTTGPDTKLDFTSDVSKVIKFAAGVEVQVIPAGAVDAKLVLKFERAQSVMIKCPVIKVSAIPNVREVAEKLKSASGWRRGWSVVYETYNAQDATVMSTVADNTEITFTGNVNALNDLKVGNADVGFTSNKKLGLDIQGKAGVVALGLFKLKLIGGGVNFLSDEEKTAPVEIEDLKGKKLENDL